MPTTTVPRRRTGAALIGAALAAVWLIGAVVGGLRPTVVPVEVPAADRSVATCEDPRPGHVGPRVRSGSLFACPASFNGRTVVVEGELIGDVLGRGTRRWVQVNDDAYAAVGPLGAHGQTLGTNSGVGVLLPAGVVFQRLGGPGARGDVVSVTGVFHTAAIEDQGGPAVIAESVELVRAGGPVADRDARLLPLGTTIAVAVAAAVWVAVWARERRRRG